MRAFTVFLSGLLFAAGLAISGMTQPSKIVGFLDFFGDWDPSLAFVMGGALLVHVIGYWWVKKKTAPILANYFSIPTRTEIDARLLGGAALFGAGWGLGGYCPGPAITSLTTFSPSVLLFFAAMLVGTLLYQVWDRLVTSRAQEQRAEAPDTPTDGAQTTSG